MGKKGELKFKKAIRFHATPMNERRETAQDIVPSVHGNNPSHLALQSTDNGGGERCQAQKRTREKKPRKESRTQRKLY